MKTIFDLALVRAIAAELGRAHARFDATAFVAQAADGLDDLELMARAEQIAGAMHAHLPRPFAAAASVVRASLGQELPPDGTIGAAAMRYMPHVVFVRTYGLDDYEASIELQAELTKRFTAEFSIRAFLLRYPQRTHAQMLAWAKNDNAHLRRLASEGMRPRLPWAPRLRAFQQDPGPVLAVLELLKDDPVQYVRRSVANALNDIAKDHPGSTLETCRRWQVDVSPERAWIVRHALRSLVAAGNREAIRVLGGADTPAIRIEQADITPRRVALGGSVRLCFVLEGTSPHAQHLLVGYAVHYRKANGTTRAKYFRLRTLTLQPGASLALSATISLAAMTTRRHYPGHHRVDAVVNGENYPLGGFDIVA